MPIMMSSSRFPVKSVADEMALSERPGEFDPDWSKIRRGWYLGSQQFGQQLLDKLEGVRAVVKRGSLGGEEIHLHNEHRAKELKQLGLAALKLHDANLMDMAKGAVDKKLLAWFIKSRTTVSNVWVSDQLYCGHPSNIPGYVRWVRETKDRKILKWCKKLLELEWDT